MEVAGRRTGCLIQPSRPIVLFCFADRRCEWRRWIWRGGVGRHYGLRGGAALLVAIRLPSGRQAQEIEHRTRRQNIPGIADQERDEENYRDGKPEHHFLRHPPREGMS